MHVSSKASLTTAPAHCLEHLFNAHGFHQQHDPLRCCCALLPWRRCPSRSAQQQGLIFGERRPMQPLQHAPSPDITPPIHIKQDEIRTRMGSTHRYALPDLGGRDLIGAFLLEDEPKDVPHRLILTHHEVWVRLLLA